MAQPAETRDLILPLAVIAVLGVMLFPLPGYLLDVLLMCNIALSLALLISAVYLSQPQRFTSLPAILLITTLFRLGLNVSTTRLILSGAAVPKVILTFGSFVVQGNFVVGVVLFAIITLVQFLVIAKGAERVAEVAARFALDAMPGRQMSIDADIRSGLIGPAEARERRRELQVESKLFGALDGAMKFVKGDAVAGLFIIAINISAGLIVGISQQGLTIGAAIEKFALYTIGDGLVSQIPALLVAVAAGIAVTRVDDPHSRFVGRDMLIQLSREPQALATTAFVLIGLGFVPGLPLIPFAAMAAVLGAAASRIQANRCREERRYREVEFRPKVLSGLTLRLSARCAERLQAEAVLPQQFALLRGAVFERRGVLMPDLQFEIDAAAADIKAVLSLNGVGIVQFSRGGPESESGERLSDKVLELFEAFIAAHLHELVDDSQTRTLLEIHRIACEDLINSVIPELISVTSLTTILRRLVAERVSVQSMNVILQAIAEARLSDEEAGLLREAQPPPRRMLAAALVDGMTGSTAGGSGRADTVELLAAVRVALKRVIALEVVGIDGTISGWLLAAELDELISRSALAGLVIDPAVLREILAAIRSAAAPSENGQKLVIVASRCARTYLAGLLPREFSSVYVIAADELPDEIGFRVLGELSVNQPLPLRGSGAGEGGAVMEFRAAA